MKKILIALATVTLLSTGCATTAHLKIPADTTLEVTDRAAQPDSNGDWKTSPFFWSSISGANYTLRDKGGKVIRTGKLKTHFRVVSIFWPPVAIAYWPAGFREGTYDLTVPGDGTMVTDDMTHMNGAPAKAAAPVAVTDKAAEKAAKKAAKKAKKEKKKADAEAAPATN